MLHHGGNSLAVSSPDYLMESKTEALDSNYKKKGSIWWEIGTVNLVSTF